jgi:four helix bundle protein
MHDSDKLTPISRPPASREPRWRFEHHLLDAYWVAKQALVGGMAISRKLPRGYNKLKDQLERALQGQFTQTTEAAARTGADRAARFRAARAEAGEAAGVLEVLVDLKVADAAEVDAVLELLWRLCAMLTRLGRLGRP